MNEIANHINCEFMEIEISSGKILYLTKKDVLKTWNITEEELDNMKHSQKCTDDDLLVKCDGKFILIKI